MRHQTENTGDGTQGEYTVGLGIENSLIHLFLAQPAPSGAHQRLHQQLDQAKFPGQRQSLLYIAANKVPEGCSPAPLRGFPFLLTQAGGQMTDGLRRRDWSRKKNGLEN
jgi:hypothetical protein